jgi:small subunit ribosomal protein S5
MAYVETVKEFEERVIAIDRVARVQKGGRRFRFRAIVVVGDGKGRVGLGVGKGSEVMTSITKAVAIAKKSMITVPMRGTSIPHEVTVRFCGAKVMLKPASEGTGVIAGGAVRSVVEAAGIHDLLTKSFGSTNKVNNAYATIMALTSLQSVDYGRPKDAVASQPPAEQTAESKTAVKTDKPAAKQPAAKPAVKKPAAKQPAAKAKESKS